MPFRVSVMVLLLETASYWVNSCRSLGGGNGMTQIFIQLERKPIELELLNLSPLFRLSCIVIDLMAQRGPIPLTKKLAFKRNFVAETFNLLSWHACDAELFGSPVVRDQHTFGLLAVVHQVLFDLKIADYVGRQYVLTEEGRSLRTREFELFYNIFPHFLFRIEHTYCGDQEAGPDRDWLKILGTIHKIRDDISFYDLCLAISGHEVRMDAGKDPVRDDIDSGIIRPFCWSGLLEQSFVRTDGGYEYRYCKTALWPRVFVLNWLDELAAGVSGASPQI